jgi:hypothetical protein
VSSWSDRWNIGGGAPGNLVSISLFGRTTYQFAITGIAGISDTRAFNVTQSVSVSTRPDFGQELLETADFVDNAGVGFIDWSFKFTGTVGVPVNVNSSFSASSGCRFDLPIGISDFDVTYSFESMKTSRLQRIELIGGVVGVHLCATKFDASAIKSVEKKGQVLARPAAWTVLIEFGSELQDIDAGHPMAADLFGDVPGITGLTTNVFHLQVQVLGIELARA